MKALLLREYRRLEIVDLPQPEPAQGELLVRVRACGICGSDVHGFDGSTGRRIPPLVMGHEASGIVAGTGPGVSRFRVGDRVAFDSMMPCGSCIYCVSGRPNLCDHRQVLGVACQEFRRAGAYAEYVTVPERISFHIPDNVSFEHAALLEPISVTVHAVNLLPVRLGDSAVVVGCGTIGLLSIQALRIAGCGKVIAIDHNDDRLAVALGLGASVAVNARQSDPRSAVLSATGSRGADLAVEAVGATEPVTTAVTCLRKGGSVALVGNFSPQIGLPLQAIVTREIRLLGSCACANEYPACIEMLSREAICVDPLISAKAPLSDGVPWFNRLYAREPGLLKIILEP